MKDKEYYNIDYYINSYPRNTKCYSVKNFNGMAFFYSCDVIDEQLENLKIEHISSLENCNKIENIIKKYCAAQNKEFDIKRKEMPFFVKHLNDNIHIDMSHTSKYVAYLKDGNKCIGLRGNNIASLQGCINMNSVVMEGDIEILEEYRGKGYGKALYDIYDEYFSYQQVPTGYSSGQQIDQLSPDSKKIWKKRMEIKPLPELDIENLKGNVLAEQFNKKLGMMKINKYADISQLVSFYILSQKETIWYSQEKNITYFKNDFETYSENDQVIKLDDILNKIIGQISTDEDYLYNEFYDIIENSLKKLKIHFVKIDVDAQDIFNQILENLPNQNFSI